MKRLYPIFLANIRRFQLLTENDTVVVGFSGGKDSVTLLHLLLKLRQEMPLNVVAAYLNHGLRPDAAAEQEWVTGFCRDQGVALEIAAPDVRRFRQEQKLNLEHSGSMLRYRFFEEVARQHNARRIATAHTRSDLAETFFIKLLRGSGLQGLTAIWQDKEKRIIRPLLVFTSAEIRGFLKRNRLTCYEDSSNQDTTFLRNRIRRLLLPVLRKLEPHVEERVFQTVSLFQQDFECLCQQARNFLSCHLILKRILPLPELANLHLSLQRHVIREYLRLLKGNLQHVNFQHVDTLLNPPPGCRGISLPGIQLKMQKGYLYPADMTTLEFQHSVPGPGVFAITEITQELVLIKKAEYRQPTDNLGIIVPAGKLAFPLTVRSARRQDKYCKIHSAYEQSVFEMIRVSGLPAALRSLHPLLQNGDGRLLWVLGSPVADDFRVDDPAAANFFYITFRKSGAISPISS